MSCGCLALSCLVAVLRLPCGFRVCSCLGFSFYIDDSLFKRSTTKFRHFFSDKTRQSQDKPRPPQDQAKQNSTRNSPKHRFLIFQLTSTRFPSLSLSLSCVVISIPFFRKSSSAGSTSKSKQELGEDTRFGTTTTPTIALSCAGFVLSCDALSCDVLSRLMSCLV